MLLANATSDDSYFPQTDNPTEEFLRKFGTKNWTQSCGPTAATMLVKAVGGSIGTITPGGYRPQPEEVLMDWFNDPKNYPVMERIRPDTPPDVYIGGRVPQFYSEAVYAVFGVPARFDWACHWNDVLEYIQKNIGIMACLKSPGHYVAIIGFNKQAQEVIYHDPWPENYWPSTLQGTPGSFRRMQQAEFFKNVQPFKVLIG